MKRLVLSLFLILGSQMGYATKPAANAPTNQTSPCAPCLPSCMNPCGRDYLLEVKGAWYYPTDSKFRSIYGTSGIGTLESTIQVYKDLYVFGSVGYFGSSGRATGLPPHYKTHLYFLPIGIGFKYLHHWYFNGYRYGAYLGLGALPTYLHIKDESPYVISKSCKWGRGGIAKAGLLVYLYESLFLDFFADYSIINVHFASTPTTIRHNADLSGLSIGGGIGYKF